MEDEFGEREVGPQFVLETNANAYVKRLQTQYPTKSIWMERKKALPRSSLPLVPVSKVK
jgi:hypothetical protein